MNRVDPADTILTHDSGGPRFQLMPFYQSAGPRTCLGWGKSHGLGTGLGLILGAKLAAPEKFAVNFMGDAAFGMTGLDFETAVRSNLPILTIVMNNSTMAVETESMARSHAKYGAKGSRGQLRRYGERYGGLGGANRGSAGRRSRDPEGKESHRTGAGCPPRVHYLRGEQLFPSCGFRIGSTGNPGCDASSRPANGAATARASKVTITKEQPNLAAEVISQCAEDNLEPISGGIADLRAILLRHNSGSPAAERTACGGRR